ncbi:MAG: pyruvate:ferredoxin (flavodoxin) oxidoreductase [Anaerolineaceae bacterium]|nr:pyruvate:ferredoxin (flavodoxin) oxidoreductase [Anaerolineaceae bacterium]
MKRELVTIDGNQATADVAYRMSEVIAIYPITPSSPMGEHADAWNAVNRANIWGTVPSVTEMQAEGGAAGAVHGALTTGALTTTFTASQGLLLMVPNMFKIAGELTAAVFHVSARSVAAQALSIFGDHSDVMAARGTGWAMLASRSVQEAHDMAAIAHAATLRTRIPFVHFFDGFRTSHEIKRIELTTNDDLRALINDEDVFAHRERGLNPDTPSIRGTAQNPDVFFLARETVNPFYEVTPGIVQDVMDKFTKVVGREYHLFDYYGAEDAERVIIIMASGGDTAEATAKYLAAQGEKVGVLIIRLFRPFSVSHFIDALPKTVKVIAALDRTKEPGSLGEPLYQDVITALVEGWEGGLPKVIGGRFGLSSKEFTPAMVKGIYDMMAGKLKTHFTVGINDDLSNLSIGYDPAFSIEPANVVRSVFWGLGSDGTVGANKNSIKIIAGETDNYGQGYFVYDSKKSGAMTTSHLRFGPDPIPAPYLIGLNDATFVACHQWFFLERINVLKFAKKGATFLLNSLYNADEVWEHLPVEVQKEIIAKELNFYIINAYDVAAKTGMGQRINTIMQTCFFYISGVLPQDEAIKQIKYFIKKTYGKRGEAIVEANYKAVDASIENLYKVEVPAEASSETHRHHIVSTEAPQFVRDVLGTMIELRGDELPVSAMPNDGTYPVGTTQWEKRNIAIEIPVWETDLCIQCGKCAFVCPHSVIRTEIYDPKELENAPETFKSIGAKGFKEFPGDYKFTVQVSPEDCTGCGMCVEACPAKDRKDPESGRKAINMAPQPPLREQEKENWEFFFNLPNPDRTIFEPSNVKKSGLLQPLMEFSGACAGCGETPYYRLLTQLYGDHIVIANATGCSSIYGGNLPTTPFTTNEEGFGPSWSNSLFEDNAEFGLGMRLTYDKQTEYATELLVELKNKVGADLADSILNADQKNDAGITEQRDRVANLRKVLAAVDDSKARQLESVADKLVRKDVWIVGGDGWAYDIGYGGLDHVLASGKNVKVLVLDTEVYSNTGGQSSKATPRGAVAKFAANGKPLAKKDLARIAMTYGNIYVARVAMGYNDTQTLRAFREAAEYDGPALIIAYTPCINHYISGGMKYGLQQQDLAVKSGAWTLFRYNPENEKPFTLDSKEPTISMKEYAYNEARFSQLVKTNEERAEMLMKLAQQDADNNWTTYKAIKDEQDAK